MKPWMTAMVILAYVAGLWTALLVFRSPEQQGLVVPYGTELCYDPSGPLAGQRRVFPCPPKGGPPPLLLVSDPTEKP